MNQKLVRTDLWEYCGKRKAKDVYNDLVTILKNEGIYDEMDYFNVSSDYNLSGDNGEDVFPDCTRIACYVSKGVLEGHYIHVDAIGGNIPVERSVVMLGKTSRGIEHALRISNLLTECFCER